MAKTIDLCTPCAAVIGEGYTLKVIRRGVNNKISNNLPAKVDFVWILLDYHGYGYEK